ncbi:hypothetical protein [Burkholderia pseudomallei]|uniref:hypothetical protein n=1 Tax=Burkholderia pseudomallei TaxID=28450 RepID=UPI0002F5922F|nr:hypothetical protein [Burkholderia pseudomallei]AGZ31407.1 putative gp43 [Burkholderia pseudomallei NCTC 13179]
MNDQQQSRADALTEEQIRAFAEGACDHEVGAGAFRQNVATVGNVILAIRNAVNLATSANETGAEEMRDAAMRTVQAMGLIYTPGSDRWRPNPNHAPDALTIPRDLLNDLIDDVQSFADQVPCREREKAFRADLLARARAIAAFPVEQPAQADAPTNSQLSPERLDRAAVLNGADQ